MKPYNDEAEIEKYEQAAIEAYEQAGFDVKWLPAYDLISMGGAIHCVTMQLKNTAL